MNYSEIIREIEAEIKTQYLGGAIRWADAKYDGAWSKAIDRFDAALTIAIERKDYRTAEIEGAYYRATVLDLIRKYKTAKNMDDADSFLGSLRSRAAR